MINKSLIDNILVYRFSILIVHLKGDANKYKIEKEKWKAKRKGNELERINMQKRKEKG